VEEPRAGPGKQFKEGDDLLDEKELQEVSEQPGGFPGLEMYVREVLATPRLTREDEVELAKRISGRGQDAEDAMRQLIEANLRLVVATAKRHANRGRGLLELIQEGNIGLMKAAQRFNYVRGYRFSTYAIWWVRQAILRSTRGK
jgi:RNA polymerase primary sigma factor